MAPWRSTRRRDDSDSDREVGKDPLGVQDPDDRDAAGRGDVVQDADPAGGTAGQDDAGAGSVVGWWAAAFPPWSRLALVVIVVVGLACWGVSSVLEGRRAERERQVLASQIASRDAGIQASQAAAQASASALASAVAALSPQDQQLRETALNYPRPTTPAGFLENTPEGAADTAQYFLAPLYVYTYATGKLERWEELCADTSVFCNHVIEHVTEHHEAHGWVDPWEVTAAAQDYSYASDDSNVIVVTVKVDSAQRLKHDIDGTTSTTEAESVVLQVQMRWTGSQWLVEAVAVK